MKFFDNLKRKLITEKNNKNFNQLIQNGKAKKFDEDFFKSFDGMYYNALPVNYYLKRMNMGRCYDASVVLGLAMGKDCYICRGNLSNIAYMGNEKSFGHGWVEKDDKVYDTTWQVIMDIKDYYKLFGAEDIVKTKQETFFENCKELSDFVIHDKKYYEENYVPFAETTVLAASYTEKLKLESLPKEKVTERTECESFLNQFPNLDMIPQISIEEIYTLQ